MLIAIDESGDFAPGSHQLSFFVAVLLQQQAGGLNIKREQFQAWLARIPKERSNKHGEVKGSELTDAQLLDFAQSIISSYPPVKIEYVHFCPAENPEEVMQAHKATEVASVYRIGVLVTKGYCWRIDFKPLLAESTARRRPDASGLTVPRLTS